MKVGIIGAGTMGSGIAQAFAQTEGYEVFLCDINEEFAANGKNKIAKGFEKRIAKGKMDQEKADAILAKITTGVKTICTDCDLVVEAALEVMDIKKQTFKELQDICKKDCIFATNTSSKEREPSTFTLLPSLSSTLSSGRSMYMRDITLLVS